MKYENNQYIAELNFKSLGKGIATGLIAGSALFGGIVGAGKLAGIGRFAPQTAEQPQETNIQQQIPNNNLNNNTNTNTNNNTTNNQNQQNTKKEFEQHQFENEHLKKLYGALVHAEHRGFVTDPHEYDPKLMIRTRSGGGKSSSYGPLQMNTTVFGFLDQKDPYVKQLKDQARKMLNSKNKDSTYGLGGSGDLSGEEHFKNYQKAGEIVIKGKTREIGANPNKQLSKEELNKFIQHWTHGMGSKNKPPQWYVDTVHKYYYGN